MIALSQIDSEIIPFCLGGRGGGPGEGLDVDKVTQLLGRTAFVDWASRGGRFEGYAGRGGAKLVKDELDRIIFAAD
jgi:hypothetical protein